MANFLQLAIVEGCFILGMYRYISNNRVKVLLMPPAAKKGIAPFDTWCVLGSSFPMQHIPRDINPKHILLSPELEPGKTYTFLLSFGNSQEAAIQRNKRQLADLDRLPAGQFRTRDRHTGAGRL